MDIETNETNEENHVRILLSDGDFSIHNKYLPLSSVIRNSLDTDERLPVTISTMKDVISWCDDYLSDPSSYDDVKRVKLPKKYDDMFSALPQSDLFNLILASHALEIKPLLDTTCLYMATIIKGKTSEEIRKQFGIKNDFTPEEEELIRKEFKEKIMEKFI